MLGLAFVAFLVWLAALLVGAPAAVVATVAGWTAVLALGVWAVCVVALLLFVAVESR